MFKKIALVMVVLIVGFSGFVAMQPNDFRIERTVSMVAATDKIFEQVNNPRKMAAWSPWVKIDPNATFTYEGPESGIGSVTTWTGNKNIGAGKATIIESKPDEYVKTRLDFIQPMQATNMGELILKQNGNQVEVTWAMSGKNNFIGKAMSIIFNCEKMVGDEFEQGLMNLKNIVEKG